MSDNQRPDWPGDAETPLARLRAADPAAGAQPDLTRLRDAIDLRRAVAPDSLDAARERRGSRSRWLQVAAVAAGALVVAAGGYGLGRATDQTPPVSAAPAMSLDGGPTAPLAQQGAASEAVAADARLSIWPGGGSGRTVFHADGFSETAGTATAWTYDPASSFSPERATSLAAALGMAGTPELVDGAWVLGPQDGTSATLWLYPDGQTSVSFYDPAKDPFQCTEPGVVEPAAPDAAGGGSEPSVAEPCRTVDLGPAPGTDAAVARLRELLAAAGLDPDAYEYVADQTGDMNGTSMTAFEVKDGRRTGNVWYLWMTGAGVQSLSGTLAPLVSLGDYPVISAAEAVARLTDPRFGTLGYAWPAAEAMAGEDTATSSLPMDDAAVAAPTAPPTVPAPGGAIPWPVEDVTLVSATLGHAQHFTAEGAVLLVPVYELADADGRQWSVIAVAEGSLDLTSR